MAEPSTSAYGLTLGVLWILGNIMGLAGGIALAVSVGNPASLGIASRFVSPVIIGAMVGTAQWLVLSMRVPPLWVVATAAGFVVAGSVPHLPQGADWALPWVTSGILQYLILRPRVRQAGWWLLATVGGGFLAFVVVSGFGSLEIPSPEGLIVVVLLWYAAPLLLTGVAAGWLMRHRVGEKG